MAVDLNELRNKVYEIGQTNSTILSVVDVAITKKFFVDHIEVPVTDEKMTEITNWYIELRDQLKALVNSLP